MKQHDRKSYVFTSSTVVLKEQVYCMPGSAQIGVVKLVMENQILPNNEIIS